MQYQNPTSVGSIVESLTAESRLSDTTLAAIEAILNTKAADGDVAVGTYTPGESGLGTYTGPEDQAPDVVLVDLAGRLAGEYVGVVLPPEVLSSASFYQFNTDANVIVNFNTVERVIVMGNGNDIVTVNGDKNTTLDGGDGNDTLTTSGGDDLVIGGHGNDSISTGAGDDTVISGLGHDTINGGTGFDMIQAAGNYDEWDIQIVDGAIVLRSLTDAKNAITAKNVEFIQLEDKAISVVATEEEATALRLYQALLGRTADREGAEYWIGDVNKEGGSTHGVAASFLGSQEFHDRGELTNAQYVQMLYENALGREAEQDGLNYWVNDLESGGYSRAELAIAIVGSAEAADVIVTVQILDGLV